MHMDIEVADIESLAGRLEQLGGRRTGKGVEAEHGSRWIVMDDPEGNEFCVCDGGAGEP
jgi:predicted enzyme related to lactoylglutathione lyase